MTDTHGRYQIVAPAGFTPVVGALAGMLVHARESVVDTVKELTVEQLDYQFDAKANPIGAMLAHLSSVEWFYQVVSIEGRQPTGNEWGEYGRFLRLGEATWVAAQGQTVEQHLARLAGVREMTMKGLAQKDDAWLAGTFALPWTTELANHHWAWYHVVEDELNHRGQM
ncbi:MAG: DinB family protein, partial [Gemmatimonadaceae bacterium]